MYTEGVGLQQIMAQTQNGQTGADWIVNKSGNCRHIR